MIMRTVAPVSPGEMLDEEFLKPLGLTAQSVIVSEAPLGSFGEEDQVRSLERRIAKNPSERHGLLLGIGH